MTAAKPTRPDRNHNGYRILRPQDGRRSNLSLLLQSLYDEPQLTRADLARSTGLTKVTISDLVAELIDDDLVQETGVTAGLRPGKRAATLAVREDTRDILAVDLTSAAIMRAGVYSIRGAKRAETSVDLAGRTGDEAVSAVIDLVEACAARATHPVLGIGVGTPGTVDAYGTVIAAPNLAWHDLPLQDIIAERFGLPVVVQNDANTAVIGEKAFAEASSTLLRVQIALGVGAGILLSGTLVTGTEGAAGEIGHVVIERDGVQCSCGKRGCLETWISAPALRERMDASPERGEEILAEAGRRLGMALAPIVAALDLQEIILGGPEDLLAGVFLEACQNLITERTHSQFRRDSLMKLSSLGNEAVLLGAVSLVLRTTLGVC